MRHAGRGRGADARHGREAAGEANRALLLRPLTAAPMSLRCKKSCQRQRPPPGEERAAGGPASRGERPGRHCWHLWLQALLHTSGFCTAPCRLLDSPARQCRGAGMDAPAGKGWAGVGCTAWGTGVCGVRQPSSGGGARLHGQQQQGLPLSPATHPVGSAGRLSRWWRRGGGREHWLRGRWRG